MSDTDVPPSPDPPRPTRSSPATASPGSIRPRRGAAVAIAAAAAVVLLAVGVLVGLGLGGGGHRHGSATRARPGGMYYRGYTGGSARTAGRFGPRGGRGTTRASPGAAATVAAGAAPRRRPRHTRRPAPSERHPIWVGSSGLYPHRREVHGDLARHGVSARRDLRRLRHQLRAVQRGRRTRRALPVRRRRRRDPLRAARGRRLRLARLPARRRAGPALRLPRARPVRPAQRAALQPEQAAARPVREGDRRHRSTGTSRCSATTSATRTASTTTTRPRTCRSASSINPFFDWGDRPPAAPPVRRDGHLRGARQGHDRAAPRDPGGAARHLRRHRAPGDDRPPHRARASPRSS